MSFLLDLLILLIIGFSVWQGYRKGLILTVAGIIIILISAWAAGRIAKQYSVPFADKIQPMLGWVADDAIDEVARGKGPLAEITDKRQLASIATSALDKLGLSFVNKDNLVNNVFDNMAEKERTFREAVSYTFLCAVSSMILCVFGFVVIMILLTLLIHFVAAVFKLPALKQLDRIGGAALGFIYAILMLTVLGWALKYTGMFMPQELIDKTVFLKLFRKSNLLTGLLGTIRK